MKLMVMHFLVGHSSAYIVYSLIFFSPFLKPNFGASLHILKLEIGGDGQSTGMNSWGTGLTVFMQFILHFKWCGNAIDEILPV